ncbi:hypothetical protein N7465_008251 [Penicillium sp. CMV-2018d]|nr:hypothetical protein N7465_008251 [Penicillium sp. CMV-2018d]
MRRPRRAKPVDSNSIRQVGQVVRQDLRRLIQDVLEDPDFQRCRDTDAQHARSEQNVRTSEGDRQDTSWKVSEIGCFDPSMSAEGGMTTINNNMPCFTDVNLFIQRLKSMAYTKSNDTIRSVHAIIAKRTRTAPGRPRADGTRHQWVEYLVRWTGRGPIDDMWLPLENLEGCEELVAEFEDRQADEDAYRAAWPDRQ